MPTLTERFGEALAYALHLHGSQVSKGGEIPYVAHLLGVTSLVIEDGGSEDEAIAALLHDGPEDAGGPPVLEEIRRRFGDEVARIVEGCSDAMPLPGEQKAPWRERKEAYLARVAGAPADVLRVSLADKLHNARRLVADLRIVGHEVWDRFNAGPADQAWYYASLRDVYRQRDASPRMLADLEPLVSSIIGSAADAPPWRGGEAAASVPAATATASAEGLDINEAVYERLVQAARARDFVFYGELARIAGIDIENPHFGAQVGRLLGDISRVEVENGRPMLSSVCVSKEDHLPGKGFFNLGQQLRRVLPGENEVSFAVREIKATHDCWSELEPFGERTLSP